MKIEKLTIDAIALLKNLIETQSFSSEEQNTALLIESWFLENKVTLFSVFTESSFAIAVPKVPAPSTEIFIIQK